MASAATPGFIKASLSACFIAVTVATNCYLLNSHVDRFARTILTPTGQSESSCLLCSAVALCCIQTCKYSLINSSQNDRSSPEEPKKNRAPRQNCCSEGSQERELRGLHHSGTEEVWRNRTLSEPHGQPNGGIWRRSQRAARTLT